MTPWVKVTATKPEDPVQFIGKFMVKEKNQHPKVIL